MNSGFRTDLRGFLDTETRSVVGDLAKAVAAHHPQLESMQIKAWTAEIDVLKNVATAIMAQRRDAADWPLLLEYSIPRRERRIDAVFLARGAVVVTEFKVGAQSFDSAGAWQVEEYALDLRDFHEASRHHPLFPVLVATKALRSVSAQATTSAPRSRLVAPVSRVAPSDLAAVTVAAAETADSMGAEPIDGKSWDASPYRPTLNIIEAAEAIFQGHQVREIAYATAENLTLTTATILQATRRAQADSRRVACFVTGVPGAGKTLTGLSAVHDPGLRREGRPAAIFLSGNGPLVKIVRSALARDAQRRGSSSEDSRREVRTFIQNVHQFLAASGSDPTSLSAERVVIFDEAQRAWNAKQMMLKRQIERSEADLLLEVMERFEGWCVVVALVGGGQEINRGEAGLVEWGRALAKRPVEWDVIASPEVLAGGSSVARQRLFEGTPPKGVTVYSEESLHLRTSVRSLRAQIVADWVNAVIDGDSKVAGRLFSSAEEFPVVMTRELDTARHWLRARGGELDRPGIFGLVASSGALRLRAYGVEVSPGFRKGFKFEDWFLANPTDVRSSLRLEVAATEFECQGLELDWVGVCWGDDMFHDAQNSAWNPRRFIGSRWVKVNDPETRQFILNKYRVLLTRARKGMVIWVPGGSQEDSTRDLQLLDATARHLAACGIPEIVDLA